jgi:Fe-S-cluster containining protein
MRALPVITCSAALHSRLQDADDLTKREIVRRVTDYARDVQESGIGKIHRRMDGLIEQAKQQDPSSEKITCVKGCQNCCKVPVHITAPEAKLLVETAKREGIEIDMDRLHVQARAGDDEWYDLPDEQRRCVFLDETGACRVYAERPMSCRKHFVMSSSDLCDKPTTRILKWSPLEAEMLASAAVSTFQTGLFSSMILQER